MLGEDILRLIGAQDPRLAMLAALQGGAAGGGQGVPAGAGTGAGTQVAAGPAAAPGGPPAQPQVYQSPNDLLGLYQQMEKYNRRAESINTGVGLIGASLAHPENRAGILSAFTGGGSGGGSGGGEDPTTFMSSIMKFQQDQQAIQRQAAIRATLPAIAKRYGLDLDTAAYLYETGKLDSVISEAEKPDRQIVTNDDGTSAIVNLTTGEVGQPFGKPKPREIELVDDPTTGGKIAVYKDTKERVGKNDIAGAGNTETEQLWNATNRDRAAHNLPPLSLEEFNIQSKRAGSGAANLGPSGIDYGNPEAGYAWKRDRDGSIVTNENGQPVQIPIAGGSVEAAEKTAAEKAGKQGDQRAITSDIVTNNIDAALGMIDENADGWVPVTGWGAMLNFIPGTPQYDVEKAVETVRANIGMDKLQQMRAAAPTGASGLGQVSDFENKLLQSTFGSLDLKQSPERVKKQLFIVRSLYDDIVNRGIAKDTDSPEAQQAAAKAATQRAEEAYNARYGQHSVDDLLQKYGHE